MKVLIIGILMLAANGACAQVPPKGATHDEILGITPWHELEIGLKIQVSFYDLIANGNKYDNQYVQVQGFFRYEKENGIITRSELFANTESLEYDVLQNSLKIREMLPDCYGVNLTRLDGEFLVMSGMFRNIPHQKTLTPVDHIRLYKLNEETREIEVNEILCNDSTLIFLQKPDGPSEK